MQPSEIAQRVLEEHRCLDEQINLLRMRMAAPWEKSLSEWFARGLEHFRHFHTQLRRHMEMEESGGFLKPAADKRPTLIPLINRLRSEHSSMIASCVEIERLLENREGSSQDVERVRRMIDVLLQHLHTHEEAENELLQRAFTLDIGTGD